MRVTAKVLAKAILVIAATIACATAGARLAEAKPPYTGLVVFGDSMSDNGNVGRFSNGPVWVEVIARRLGRELKPSRAGGTNFAVAGARTHGRPTDIRGQTHSYISATGRSIDGNALYIIYGGANDLLAGGCAPDKSGVARTAAAAIRATVDELVLAGARHILVPNLPDIGYAPIVRAQGKACTEEARRRTRAFNVALERSLQEVEAKRQVRITRLDVFALGDEVMSNPAQAGFRNVDAPCAGSGCDGDLFYDTLHLASGAHARLASAALQAIGLPAGE